MKYELIVERIDKNGSKHILDRNCPKCGGSGYIPGYEYIDGARCWKCGATGYFEQRYVKHTEAYQAVLNAKKDAKKAKANMANRPAFLEKEGFSLEGITYVVVGDTFNIKDELKAAGAKFNAYIKWHFSTKPEQYECVEMTINECFTENNVHDLYWNEEAKSVLQAKMPATEKPLSNYVGVVGEKISLQLTQLSCHSFDGSFGTTYINIFKDDLGNKFVWKTSYCVAKDNEKVALKGTVKEHSEYKNEKQTVLTRCKIS